MTTAVLESERKYEVPAGASLPDWSAVEGVASVLGPEQTELDAHYFDTSDLRLLGAGYTLRNRAGGDDAGWHAKVPAGGGDREELRFPSQPGMPEELAGLFVGIARGAELVEVARLKTTRTTWTLLDDAGSALAEVAADQVTATVPQRAGTEAATVRSWHEVEIELVGGADRRTADRLGAVMADAGFPVSSSKSKLARALDFEDHRPGKPGSAGAVVLVYVRKHAHAVRQQDIAIRRDLPDAVHQARVASRKLRATLKTFRPVLRRAEVDPLRKDMQWYERQLSGARDAEVMSKALHDEVGQVPVEHVLGPVAANLTAHFAREEATAADTVARTMASKRYFRMLDRLDRLLTDPPLRKKASKKAGKKALRKSARKAWRRVRKAVARSESATVGPDLNAALHRARKETRKARYAADALKPAFGKKVRTWRKHLKSLQDALGEQHDAVVTGAQLRQLAIRTHASGGNAYTYGLLYARQDERGRAAYREFRAQWTNPPSKVPGWLD